MPARRRRTDLAGDSQRRRGGESNNRIQRGNVRTWSSSLKLYLLPIAILGILLYLLATIQYGGKSVWKTGGSGGGTIRSEADLPFGLEALVNHLYLEFTGKPLAQHRESEPECTISLSSKLQKDSFALRVITFREAAKCAIILGLADQSGMPSAAATFAQQGNDDPRLLRLLEKSTLTKYFDLPAAQIVHFEKYYELKD